MKETWDKTSAPLADICARAEDLIAYLYGEASQVDATDFEKHLKHCTACRAELLAFGNVREAIGEWRQETLGALAPLAREVRTATLLPAPNEVKKSRSAFAAIREFLTLSPVWMRAATAVAVLLFCALAAIAVAYFIQQPQTVVIERGYSEEQMKQKIAEALKGQDSNKVNEAPAATSALPTPEDKVAQNPPTVPRPTKRNNPQLAANRGNRQIAPRTTLKPSTELVRADDYLPFTASKDEEKLPSLSDLVNDDN